MSDPSPLCYPDYSQVPADHRRLLVLVRSLSTHDALKPKTFARVFEVLDRGARVQINAAGGGGARNIEARLQLVHVAREFMILKGLLFLDPQIRSHLPA